MALPRSITTSAPPSGPSFLYPVISSSGNVYCFVSTGAYLYAYKSANPDTTAFSSQGFWNTTVSPQARSVFQLGDIVHAVQCSIYSALDVFYNTFNMSTDSWGTPTTILANSTEDTGGPYFSADVVARASNDLVAAFNGEAQSYHGDEYARIDAAYSSNGTDWTIIDATNDTTGIHYTNAVAVQGSSGRVHIVFRVPGNANHRCSTLTSSNTWGSRNVSVGTTLAASSTYEIGHGDSWSSGASLGVPYVSNTSSRGSVKTLFSADTPTFGSSLVTANAILIASNVGLCCLCVDSSGARHYLYIDNSGSDLYHDVDSGSGWGTDTLERSLSGITHLSANIYTRSGSEKLAFLYYDGSNLYYDEISLSAAAAGMVMSRRLRGLHHMLVR